MPLIPLRTDSRSDYPTQDFPLDDPELLRLLPERWRRNAVVLALLVLAAMLFCSCQHNRMRETPVGKPATHVAPIFVHGDGRGSYGCLYADPSVFLSEEEAIRVIRDTAEQYGLHFQPDKALIAHLEHTYPSPGVSGLTVFETDVNALVLDQKGNCLWDSQKDTLRQQFIKGHDSIRVIRYLDFHLDGRDAKRNIGFAFIGVNPRWSWKIKTVPPDLQYVQVESSVKRVHLLEDARTIAGDLAVCLQSSESDPPVTGLFYDPVMPGQWVAAVSVPEFSRSVNRFHLQTLFNDPLSIKDPRPNGRRLADKRQSEEQLRAQVRDFMKWLKAQGII
jgi:hypothetical protein